MSDLGAPATGTEPRISDKMREAFVLARDRWDVDGVHYSPVAAGLAAVYPLVEAEVRRKVAAEVRALFADPDRARQFLNDNGLAGSCGAGSAALAIAAEIEAGIGGA